MKSWAVLTIQISGDAILWCFEPRAFNFVKKCPQHTTATAYLNVICVKNKAVKRISFFAVCTLVLLCLGCKTIPKNVAAVNNFDKQKYLGKWYEIARFDFSFERNLNNTTAEYSANPDGTIAVVNQGYNTKKQQWKQARGKAKFVGPETIGMLKVSFFGPFYAGYNVLAVDPDYQYALVAGKNRDYLWILSRQTTLPESVKKDYLQIAERHGFDTGKLLWITHDQTPK